MFQNLAGRVRSGRVGSGQKVSNLAGRVGSRFQNLAGRVGSIGFTISRVMSGRVKRFVSNSRGSGRVGSGHEVVKIAPVGSSHDLRDTGHSRVKPS